MLESLAKSGGHALICQPESSAVTPTVSGHNFYRRAAEVKMKNAL